MYQTLRIKKHQAAKKVDIICAYHGGECVAELMGTTGSFSSDGFHLCNLRTYVAVWLPGMTN